ncbi:MAG: hypothetical protein GXP00_00890 [Alphaproteobacteria bacterium]|nr:hypothetical protein [Alphaproteobacteria bacterium]
MPLMISCRDFENFIIQYLEDELPWNKRFIINTHLKVCKECRDYLDAYRLSMAATKGALAQEELPEVPEDLVKAILAATQNGKND